MFSMQQQAFQNMIKNNEYHFFVFACPAIMPLNLAIHTWIVIVNSNGEIARWDLCHFKNKEKPSLKYIHKDWFEPRE
ncbi:MAG: hypothetical protein WCI00_09230 [bacterium]